LRLAADRADLYAQARAGLTAMVASNLTALFSVAEPERLARLREFRLAALLLLGRKHPVTQALAAAVADPDALAAALAEVDRLAAIPRRRLLAAMAVVLPVMW
jgi:hypothetical protein